MKKKEKILSLAFMIGLLFLETNNLKASVPIDYFVDIVKEFEVKREAIPALAKKLKIITTKAIPSIDELAKNPINAKRISDLIRNVLRRMTPAEVKGIVKAAQTKAAVLVAAEAARVAKAALVVEKQAEIAKYTGFFELNA